MAFPHAVIFTGKGKLPCNVFYMNTRKTKKKIYIYSFEHDIHLRNYKKRRSSTVFQMHTARKIDKAVNSYKHICLRTFKCKKGRTIILFSIYVRKNTRKYTVINTNSTYVTPQYKTGESSCTLTHETHSKLTFSSLLS